MKQLNKFVATSGSARPARKAIGTHFAIERLETRDLKAISITAIYGNYAVNIHDQGASKPVSATFTLNTMGTPSKFDDLLVASETIDGQTETQSVLFTKVSAMEFNGGLGNDVCANLTSHGANISGGPGNDTLIGGTGPDALVGGAGSDSLYGGGGDDGLSGGDGNADAPSGDSDHLFGEGGSDWLYGGGGGDVLEGGAGADIMFGLAGNDTLHGGDGYDYLSGGAGNDFLGAGADAFSDMVIGGEGVDTFKLDYYAANGVLVSDRLIDYNINPKVKDKLIV